MRRMYQRPSSACTSLVRGSQIDEHPAGIVQKRLVGEAHQDVPDRPAQVGGDQAHQAGDRRRVALDPELLVEEQGGDAGAGQEVHHVVVGAFQLVDLLLEADVDGVELLVEGLELLLGGLHLLVGGLELFVGRHDLLVGGLELVVGALQLVDGALELLAGDLQLVRQLTDIPVRRGLPAGFCGREALVLEGDQEQAVGFSEVPQGADRGLDRHRFLAALGAGGEGDGPAGFDALGDRPAQPGPQAFPGHVHDPGGQLARGDGQVVLDHPMHVEHLELPVDHHAGGGKPVQEGLLGHRGQARSGERGRCRWFEQRRLGGGTGRDFDIDAMADADAAVDPPFLRDRLEEVLPVSDGLGVSQKEKAPVAQGEVKQGDDLLLHLLVQVNQEIAADDQVQPGEGRIGGDVLRGENDPLADALDDLITAVPAGKEPLRAARPRRSRRSLPPDSCRCGPLPARRNRRRWRRSESSSSCRASPSARPAAWPGCRPPCPWSSRVPRPGSPPPPGRFPQAAR